MCRGPKAVRCKPFGSIVKSSVWQGLGDYRINLGWGFLLWVKFNFLTIQNPAWVELVDPLLCPIRFLWLWCEPSISQYQRAAGVVPSLPRPLGNLLCVRITQMQNILSLT